MITLAHKNLHKLQKHRMTHTGEKAHKCNQCLPCVHALSFKIPMRTHMWEKSCKCSQCDYTCTRVANLHTHMLTHTEVRAFNCDQCIKIFTHKSRASVSWISRYCRVNVAWMIFFAVTRLSNSPCTFQRWSIPTFGAPLESLDRQNSISISHSPISEHLKLAETETVSSPPFRDIGPPTHLLGEGRGNLTREVPPTAPDWFEFISGVLYPFRSAWRVLNPN